MRYFTFRRQALAVKAAWQQLRFTAGKGYWLFGTRPVSGAVTMYDSITLSQIPATAEAVAGYVNGHWPTFPAVVEGWPHAHKLSIAVNAAHDADCLDVERGDASNADSPAWVKRQQQRGVRRPVVYTSVSNAAALLSTLARAGVGRGDIRLWTAHYTYKPHLCGSRCQPGFNAAADATQYTDHQFGRNLDASLVTPGFFG